MTSWTGDGGMQRAHSPEKPCISAGPPSTPASAAMPNPRVQVLSAWHPPTARRPSCPLTVAHVQKRPQLHALIAAPPAVLPHAPCPASAQPRTPRPSRPQVRAPQPGRPERRHHCRRRSACCRRCSWARKRPRWRAA
eukprot:364332-Chlamydomonas_euryale.AAC.4